METLIHTLFANRQHNRIWTFMCLKRIIQIQRGFIGTSAMATYVNTQRLDLGSLELGLDMCVAIKRGIAMEDVVTRVIGV
jgi:hypothetical protein